MSDRSRVEARLGNTTYVLRPDDPRHDMYVLERFNPSGQTLQVFFPKELLDKYAASVVEQAVKEFVTQLMGKRG